MFRLIDRASPALRNIERRANATDRALNRTGRNLDKIAARDTIRRIDRVGASMKGLEGNTGRVERVMNKTGATSRALDRDLDKVGRGSRKVTSDMGGLERAMRKVVIIGGGLGKLFAPVKWAAIAVAIRPLIGAVAALGGGAIALVGQVGRASGALVPMISRLGDLAGAGAAAATVMLSVKAASLVTKFAMHGVTQAINGNVAAFKRLTPQAKAFVREMRQLRPIMNTIRQSAQTGLFGGLTRGIRTARRNGAFQVANQAAGGMGRAVGGVASRAASQLTNPAVLRDLASLSNTADVVITRLGATVTNLAQAFIGVLYAAQPLTRWLMASIQHWSKYLMLQVQTGRQTGALGRYFSNTRRTLTVLGHTVRDFGMGFLNVMRVARGESGKFGTGIQSIAKHFRAWTENFSNQGKMALWFQRAQGSAHQLSSILSSTLRILLGLGKASQALGQNMTGGIAQTMRRWAEWINSFQGQNATAAYFNGLRTTLSALWNLVSDLAGALTRLGAGGGGAAGLIGNIRALIPDLERLLRSFSVNIGPGLFGTIQQLAHLLGTLAGAGSSPLGSILNATYGILRTVNSILDRFHAVRVAAVAAFIAIGGAILLQRLLKIAQGVGGIAKMWQAVTGSTRAATIAAEEYNLASRGGRAAGPMALNPGAQNRRTPGGGTTPTTAPGRFGGLGGALAGGALAIGAPIVGNLLASQTSGQGASALSNVGNYAGMGAMMGMAGGAPGMLAGGIIGGIAGLGMTAFQGDPGPSPTARYAASLGRTASAQGFDINQAQGGAQNLGQANRFQRVLDRSRTRLLGVRKRIADSSAGRGSMGGQLLAQIDAQIKMNQRLRLQSIGLLGIERARKKALDAQTHAMREQARARQSRSIASGLLTSYGNAYNIYRRSGMSVADATHRTVTNMENRAKTLNPAGAKVLMQGGVSWLAAMKKQHPEVAREYDRWDKDMRVTLKKMGVTVTTEGGKVLTATGAQWSKIKTAMQQPMEQAAQQVSTQFTTMQNAARGMLVSLGYSPSSATAIIRSMEGGAAGPSAGAAGARSGATSRVLPRPKGFQFSSLGGGFAQGGRIPGRGLQDTVPIGGMAAPGELIVNRHTESKADRVLRMAGTSLSALVSGEKKRHSDILPDAGAFAKGGRVGAAVSEANRIAALRLRYQFGGGHSTPAPANGPFDCSSATSRVLQAAGYNVPTMTSSGFMKWGERGPGPIGIAANAGHVYMMLNGKAWGTSRSNPGGGPGWIPGGGWRAGFTQRHAPGGGGARGGGLNGMGGANLPLLGGIPYGAFGDGLNGLPLAASLRVGHIVAAGMQGRINTQISKRNRMRTRGGGGVGGGGGNSAQNQTLARAMMLAGGWNASQWPSLKNLWMRESGFSTTATGSQTPMGRAYGIPQSLPGNKMASVGGDWMTNPRTQIKWGLNYIRSRYGTPDAAWAHSEAMNPHWYAKGGRTPDWGGWHAGGLDRTFSKPTMIGVGEKGKERVTVTPSGSSGAGGITINMPVTIHGGNAAEIRKELDQAFEELARTLEKQHLVGGNG